MGLDMYMSANRWLLGESYGKPIDQMSYEIVTTSLGLTQIDIDKLPRKNATVSITVGYWRKAHDIHQWFVDNVQNGEDNCAQYDVSRTELIELKEAIQRVLADPDQYHTEFSSNYDWDSDVEAVFTRTWANIDLWLSPTYNNFDFQYSSSW